MGNAILLTFYINYFFKVINSLNNPTNIKAFVNSKNKLYNLFQQNQIKMLLL